MTLPGLFNQIVLWVAKVSRNQRSLVVDAIELMGSFLKNYHPIDDAILTEIFDPNFLENHLETRSKNKVDAITLATIRLIEAVSLDVLQDHSNFDEQMIKVAGNCLDILSTVDVADFGQNYYDLATRSLSIIRHVIHFHPEWIEDSPNRLPLLIGCFKAFISLKDDVIATKPQPVQPSQLSLLEPVTHLTVNKNRKVIRNKKKPRVNDKIKKVDESKSGGLMSGVTRPLFQHVSDSDYSEKENESNPEKYIFQQRFKLRLMTINLITTLAQSVDKKLLFGYFHTLFSEPSTSSLLMAITNDSSVKCRTSALQAVTLLLFRFRQYLMLAEINNGGTTSFTPLVVAIGNTLLSLYELFSNILARETHTDILIQTLKATATLIEVTPLQRCQVNVIAKIVPHVHQLLKLQDLTLKVACLHVMQAVYSCEGMSEALLKDIELNQRQLELEEIEYDEIEDREVSVPDPIESDSTANNWLLEELYNYLGLYPTKPPIQNLQLRIQSLQTLQGVAVFIQLYAATDLVNISKALKGALLDHSSDIKLHASRTHEIITRNLNKLIVENTDYMHLKDPYYGYWNELQEVVTKEIQTQDKTAVQKSILMDSLVNVECIYERLSRDRQLFLVSFVNGTAFDEDPELKGSAVRCLSIYSRFPCLRDDYDFLENGIEISANSIHEPEFVVKLKASWALANFSDIFAKEGKVKVSQASLKSMFQACVPQPGVNVNEKIRTNLIRCLGNLLKVVEPHHVKALGELCHAATNMIAVNIKSKESMKLKWNSCHAAQNMMKNEVMFAPEFGWKWQDKMFDHLFHDAMTSTNFKVKNSCVNAIASAEKRSHYGSLFVASYKLLIDVLINSNNMVDYNEYKHKENLQEEICLAISHFFVLMTVDDVEPFVEIIESNQDMIKNLWTRSINRMVPEKFQKVAKVVEAFKILEKRCHKSALHTLLHCFSVQ